MLKHLYETARALISDPTVTTANKIKSLTHLAATRSLAIWETEDATAIAALLRSEHTDQGGLLFATLSSPTAAASHLAIDTYEFPALDDDKPSIDKTASPHDIERQRMAKWLINQGANKNTRKANGMTPLMVAAAQGDICMLRFLIKAGVDLGLVDRNNNSAFMHLLSAPCSMQVKAEMFELLLQAGAKITDPNSLLFGLIEHCHSSQEEEKKAETTPVSASLAIARKLCAHEPRADVNARRPDNITPLIAAIQRGATSMVAFLMDAKADLELVDQLGQSAMVHAINTRSGSNRTDIFKLLLPYYLNRSINQRKQTPLMMLLEDSHLHIINNTALINLCLAAKPDLNHVDHIGASIWIYAARITDTTTILQTLLTAFTEQCHSGTRPTVDLTTAVSTNHATPLSTALNSNNDAAAIKIIAHLHQQKQTAEIRRFTHMPIDADRAAVVAVLLQYDYLDVNTFFERTLHNNLPAVANLIVNHPKLNLLTAADAAFSTRHQSVAGISSLRKILLARLQQARGLVTLATDTILKDETRYHSWHQWHQPDILAQTLQTHLLVVNRVEIEANALTIIDYVHLRGQSDSLCNSIYFAPAKDKKLLTVVKRLFAVTDPDVYNRINGNTYHLWNALFNESWEVAAAIAESVSKFPRADFTQIIQNQHRLLKHSTVSDCMLTLLKRFPPSPTEAALYLKMELDAINRTTPNVALINALLSLGAMNAEEVEGNDPLSRYRELHYTIPRTLIELLLAHPSLSADKKAELLFITLAEKLIHCDGGERYEAYIKQILALKLSPEVLKQLQIKCEKITPSYAHNPAKKQVILSYIQLALNKAQLQLFCSKEKSLLQAEVKSASSSSTTAWQLRLYDAMQQNDSQTFINLMATVSSADIAKCDGKLLGSALSFWLTVEFLQGKPLMAAGMPIASAEAKDEEKPSVPPTTTTTTATSSSSTAITTPKVVNIATFLAAIEEAKAWDAYVPCNPYSKSAAVKFMLPLHIAFLTADSALIHRLLKHVPHSQWIAEDAAGRIASVYASTALPADVKSADYDKQAQLEDYSLYFKTRSAEGDTDKDSDYQKRVTIQWAFHQAADGRAAVSIAQSGATALSKPLQSNRASTILTKIAGSFPPADDFKYQAMTDADEQFNNNRLQVTLKPPRATTEPSPTSTAPQATFLSKGKLPPRDMTKSLMLQMPGAVALRTVSSAKK